MTNDELQKALLQLTGVIKGQQQQIELLTKTVELIYSEITGRPDDKSKRTVVQD